MINVRRAAGWYIAAVLAISGTEWAIKAPDRFRSWQDQRQVEASSRAEWFTYKAIELTHTPRAGQDIKLRSIAEVLQPLDFRFSDTLYCDLNDGHGMRNYSSQPNYIENIKPSGFERAKPWVYPRDKVPNVVGATCFIRAFPVAVVPYGVEKHHREPIYSEVFVLEDPAAGGNMRGRKRPTKQGIPSYGVNGIGIEPMK